VVASLGNDKYDLMAAGDRNRNFYMWNAMGLASSMGLGLAMARPETRVIVSEGDGSLLMNLGALATIAVRSPENLVYVSWDNRQYAMTGGQETATAFRTDLAKVAEGAGIAHVERVETLAAFQKAFDRALTEPGPWFIHVPCITGEPKGKLPPPTTIKQRFMEALGVSH